MEKNKNTKSAGNISVKRIKKIPLAVPTKVITKGLNPTRPIKKPAKK